MWCGGRCMHYLELMKAHSWPKKGLARPAGLEPATT